MKNPTRPCARAPAPASAASRRLHCWAWRASRRRPSAFWGGGGSRSKRGRPIAGKAQRISRGARRGGRARATAALLEEKASSELGAAERLKAVERGYEKALEATSREHEAQLAADGRNCKPTPREPSRRLLQHTTPRSWTPSHNSRRRTRRTTRSSSNSRRLILENC